MKDQVRPKSIAESSKHLTASLVTTGVEAMMAGADPTGISAVIDAIPHLVWSALPTGDIDYCNTRWLTYTGLTPAEIQGDGWMAALHPDDKRVTLDAWQRATSTGAPYEVEQRLRGADGDYRWFLTRGLPLRDAEGRIIKWYGTCTDIQAKKDIAASLDEQKSRFQAMFNTIPDAVVLATPDRRIAMVNPAFTRIFGYCEDEAVGQVTEFLYVDPEDYHLLGRRLSQPDATPADRHFELCFRHKDGQVFWCDSVATTVLDESGNAVALLGIHRDISRRKAASEAVLRSEALFRAVFEASGTGMVICDPRDGRFVRVNEKFCEITGYDATELTSMTFPQLTHPVDRGADWSNYQLLVEGVTPEYTVEKRYIRKDGRIIWVRINCVITRRADGSPEYDVAVVQDVTDRKAFEQSLRDSEARFRTMADNIAQLAWMAQPSGWIYWYNQRWFEYTGTTLKEMEGWGWQKVHHPDHVQRVTDKFRYHIRHGKVWEDTFPIRSAQGEYRWFLSRAVPIRDERGDVVHWFGTNTDVTEQRSVQDALRASEAEFRALFELSAVGMFLLEPRSGRIVRANSRYCEIVGYSLDELLTMRLGDLTHLEDREHDRQLFWDAIEHGHETWTNEKRYLRKDGRIIWIHISGTIMRDTEGRAYRCMAGVRDITDQKTAEAELERLNETLEQRVRERTAEVYELADQLRALASELTRVEQRERKRLARILHDHIQQLLVAAQMQLEWVRRDPTGERTESSVQGVVSIIKEAIAASRSLTVELSPPILHEAGLTGGLTWLAARMEEKNQFKVHVRADTHAEPTNEETRFLLFESVRELLFNSVKHSGSSEAFVVMTRGKENMVHIVVEDRGAGFDPAEARERSRDAGSFGLFSIQHRLAHVGGAMEIETTTGCGVRVTLRAPLGDAQPLHHVNLAAPSPLSDNRLRINSKSDKIRVLLVDDHKILRDGIAGLLQFEPDMDVVGEAADGRQAVALAETQRPDVVIMDVNMPELNGVEATRILREKLPEVKVIGLSMHMERDTAALMRKAGAVAYLTKGGPFEDLLAAIRACRS